MDPLGCIIIVHYFKVHFHLSFHQNPPKNIPIYRKAEWKYIKHSVLKMESSGKLQNVPFHLCTKRFLALILPQMKILIKCLLHSRTGETFFLFVEGLQIFDKKSPLVSLFSFSSCNILLMEGMECSFQTVHL